PLGSPCCCCSCSSGFPARCWASESSILYGAFSFSWRIGSRIPKATGRPDTLDKSRNGTNFAFSIPLEEPWSEGIRELAQALPEGCPLGSTAMNEIDLRDAFAGHALQGLLAGPNAPKKSHTESPEQYAERVAVEAFLLADAMLRQRLRDDNA